MHFTKSPGAGKARFEQTQITPKCCGRHICYSVCSSGKGIYSTQMLTGKLEEKRKDTLAKSPPPPPSIFSLMEIALPQEIKCMHQPQQTGHREDGGHRPLDQIQKLYNKEHKKTG